MGIFLPLLLLPSSNILQAFILLSLTLLALPRFLSAYTKKKMGDCPKVHWTSFYSFLNLLSPPSFSLSRTTKKADTRAFQILNMHAPEFAFFPSNSYCYIYIAIFCT